MQEAEPLARISSIRYALVILDGLADRPIPENGGRTPTEAAFTPQLDHACTIGRLGQVVVLGPGIAPESDAGVFALLGYDPVRDSPGRGVLEAEGAGIDLATGGRGVPPELCDS
ncbi:cofactor-independent phosphoglycerate mutase, partial [mine drainage metagenome]